jgi:hypothetical protein
MAASSTTKRQWDAHMLTVMLQKEPRQIPQHTHLGALSQVLVRRLPHVGRHLARHCNRRKQILAYKLLERPMALVLHLQPVVQLAHWLHQSRRTLLRRRQRQAAHQQRRQSERREREGRHKADCDSRKKVPRGSEQGVWTAERGRIQGTEEAIADYETED